MTDELIRENLDKTFYGIEEKDVPKGTKLFKGKIRDTIELGDEMLIITSDRISAFDRILSTIPFKGEVLNKMALYWFENTKDIIKNHISKVVSARTILVKKCKVLPVEVIVRGYLTGSAWRDYSAGKDVSGIRLPEGLKFNHKFEKPLLTPSTKAEFGEHDQPISSEEIVRTGLVDEAVWKQVEKAAFDLFQRGTELAARQGLILVDTKYEFGMLNGELVLVDEVHTPGSSRFWYSASYDELYNDGKEQKQLDKEFFRQWLIERGYMGDGECPEITDEVRTEIAKRYIDSYENISGEKLSAESFDSEAEKKEIQSYLKKD